MPIHALTPDELRAAATAPPTDGWATPGGGVLATVDLDDLAASGDIPGLHTGIPAVVVGLTRAPDPDHHPAAASCDLVLGPDDQALTAVAAAVESHPLAAASLALLLRASDRRTLDDGLLAESAVYSALQAGPEFARWRAGRPARRRRPGGDPVALARDGDVLHVTLDRPRVRNALDTEMRDRLVDAFELAAHDGTISAVHLRGDGPSFCAGGDLDEFGTFPDPATAHLVRLRRSAGRAIAAVADRVTAHLHGACVGSGIELPAFAGTVLAAPSTTISLPEVSLGLVPGAGGTVSLPRRIGRHRTARLALSGRPIDAATALAWGLVDAIVEP